MSGAPAVRPERPDDHAAIADIVRRAFADVAYSDHREHELVARLRGSAAFVPALSLVAETDGALVGHVMLTAAAIREGDAIFPVLALAPLSVVPERQGQGVGAALVEAAHARARRLGHRAIVVVGHADYYPRFGYAPLAGFGVALPFEVPPESAMALPLAPGALDGVTGTVAYPPEWLLA